MFKTIGKVALVGLVVVGAITAVKSSSYVATIWNNARQAVSRQVPRELEIERVRLQVSRLDGDVRGLLPSIAEKMALVKQLEKDIATAQQNTKAQREYVVALTREVESGEAVVSVRDKAKNELDRKFVILKRGETALKSQEKLLEAHRKNLQHTKEQLNVMLDQKKEFELRLAQLEANEAQLTVERQVTPLHVDESRIADIKATLDAIERGQEVDANRLELERLWAPRIQESQQPASVRPASVDLNEIKAYLGLSSTAVADAK